jgi:hypothetical protein
MSGAGGPARANGYELARVFKRLGSVEVLLCVCGGREKGQCREKND